MRTRHTLTATLVSLVCAILAASCVQSPPETSEADSAGSGARAADMEPIGEAAQPAYEDTFHFVVDVKDDGEGDGGGWQKATAKLGFFTWTHTVPYFFKCPIVVGMPIRSKLQGRISPQYAAKITAEIATEVTDSLMHSKDWDGQGAVYCIELRKKMEHIFKGSRYKIGATVTQQ